MMSTPEFNPLKDALKERFKSRSASMRTVSTLEDTASLSRKSTRKPISNLEGLKAILWSPLSILLVFAPLGIASPLFGCSDKLTFWFNFLAMVPLAKILGDATEELAANLKNDTLAGLLNATFGNAVEMIMTVCFLRSHEYLVVKMTLLGSVLSNMLLVLGMSFLLGGLVKSPAAGALTDSIHASSGGSAPLLAVEEGTIRNKEQRFNKIGGLVNASMLLMSCLALGLVTAFNYTDGIGENDSQSRREQQEFMLPISRRCSILLLMSYIAYIVFQLFTHRDAIADEGDDDDEDPSLTTAAALALLAITTVIVATCSEFLSDALEGALEGSIMSKAFVGIILLPIVGNACEHAAAIRFAMQDKMGLSVGIAVGSSVQISLCVVPFAVLVGWALGDAPNGQNMNLDFGLLNITVMTLSVLILLSIIVDGKSNWMEGYMLCTVYCIVAILYWYLPGH